MLNKWIFILSLSLELRKASKRMSCSKRYKIQKKVRLFLYNSLQPYYGRGPFGPDQLRCSFIWLHWWSHTPRRYFTFRSPGLGSGTQQKTEKRGEKERSEQTGEEGPWRAQHCSLQRRGPERGRAKKATGLLPSNEPSSCNICLNLNKVWVKHYDKGMFR